MASVASQLIEEVTAHERSDNLEDAREICADGTYFPNNLRMSVWSSVEVRLGSYGRAFGDHHSKHVCYRNPYVRKSKVCRCLVISYVGKYVVKQLRIGRK